IWLDAVVALRSWERRIVLPTTVFVQQLKIEANGKVFMFTYRASRISETVYFLSPLYEALLRILFEVADDEWIRVQALWRRKSYSQHNETIGELRKLHDLRVGGVLSEPEFNVKKWDVLAHRD
ncbi:MAG: hypothetical protein LC723_06920, partial [Actinobacteria bacterium]|nr:hypothetical protein [Actinomycetota bacterium]